MSEIQSEPQLGQPEGGRQFGMALVAGLVIMLILGGAAYLWIEKTKATPVAQAPPLPMGAVEQAYASQIHFGDFQLSRAANFLNQQVTYVAGVASNHGQRDVAEIEVTLEFRDISQNVILREKQRMYGGKEAPLQSLTQREFQFSLENIPDGWDQRPPAFIITGLRLQ
jgi:hypothetical protein